MCADGVHLSQPDRRYDCAWHWYTAPAPYSCTLHTRGTSYLHATPPIPLATHPSIQAWPGRDLGCNGPGHWAPETSPLQFVRDLRVRTRCATYAATLQWPPASDLVRSRMRSVIHVCCLLLPWGPSWSSAPCIVGMTKSSLIPPLWPHTSHIGTGQPYMDRRASRQAGIQPLVNRTITPE